MALIRRARAVWTGVAGSPYYSNFYFLNSAGDAQDYIAAVGGLFGDLAGAVRTDARVTVEPEVPLIDSVTGEIQGVALGDAVVVEMTDVEEPLPPSTQLLIKWGTDSFVGGRRLAGKFYLGGLTQFANDGGIPSASFRSAVIGACNEFVTIPDVQACVWSRKSGAVSAITSVTSMTDFAVLRSRRD